MTSLWRHVKSLKRILAMSHNKHTQFYNYLFSRSIEKVYPILCLCLFYSMKQIFSYFFVKWNFISEHASLISATCCQKTLSRDVFWHKIWAIFVCLWCLFFKKNYYCFKLVKLNSIFSRLLPHSQYLLDLFCKLLSAVIY